jgi:predicted nuclease of predicted toxin-antitoxin system
MGHARATDEFLVELARQEQRAIVTMDRDFARIVASSNQARPSVTHLRVLGLDRVGFVALLQTVLPMVAEMVERGCVVSVTKDGIRTRTLPIRG